MSELDLHAASPAERLAAYRNVHDVWSGGLPMEQHLARRLASEQHNRANWFVGCLAGEVVTSLACYPLQFRVRGQTLCGISIGSVHTLAAFRGRGFAPRLIDWVEKQQAAAGAAISLLYSDIEPAYYGRLGYRQCPAFKGRRDVTALPGGVADNRSWRLRPIRASEQLEQIAAWYASYHGGLPISIFRDDAYWRHLLEKRPRDEFFQLEDPDAAACGYARLGVEGGQLKLIDDALTSTDAGVEEQLYRAMLDLAAERSLESAGGWLPDSPAARAYFSLEPRRDEITMLKSLERSVVLDEELIAAAHRFTEIDHV